MAFNHWAATVVPPDATVAGDLAHLPLYRRGVFYHLASSSPPNGYSTEAALREMNLPPSFSDRMTPAAYDRELETERPFLIVRGDLLSPEEKEAIKRYLDRHPTWYQTVSSPGGPVSVRATRPPAIALASRQLRPLGEARRRLFSDVRKGAIVDGQMGAPDAAIESMVTNLVVEYSLNVPAERPNQTGALAA